jgi:hypothetical protein
MKSFSVWLAALAITSSIPFTSRADLTATSWNCGPRHPGYALETFRDYEMQARQWYDRYRASPTGSQEQRYAQDQMQMNADRAVGAISNVSQLLGYPSGRVESFSIQTNQKFNISPAGSLLETFYRQASELAWNGFVRNSGYELSCTGNMEWQAALEVAENMNVRYRASPAGSMSERAYRHAMQEGFQSFLQKLHTYAVSPYVTYRELESIGVQMDQRYRASPAGSDAERFFRNAMEVSFNQSLNRFTTQLRSIHTRDLPGLISEFDMKSRSAPAGSAYERYARSMRDQAQYELNSRGPVPPPHQFWSCSVMTRRSVYSASAYVQSDAVYQARNTCMRYEPVSTCQRAQVSCRLQ